MNSEGSDMEKAKPLDEQCKEVQGRGGFYTPEWRAQQGDETDQALHRRAVETRERALAGGVDRGSGTLRSEEPTTQDPTAGKPVGPSGRGVNF